MKKVMVTCYDATFAKLCAEVGVVDYLLVGDSAGMVLQGANDTLSVTLDEMILYTKSVARGLSAAQTKRRPQLISDLPIGTYETESAALKSAAKLIAAGAEIVKLEGPLFQVIRALTTSRIRVCGHIGLTPQSIQDFKVQGRSESDAERLLFEAKEIERAGAELIVLEMIPASLAERITSLVKIPTIGIGAGAQTSGQVLVLYDLLGFNRGFNPKFLKKYSDGASVVEAALKNYARDVVEERYPDEEHSFR